MQPAELVSNSVGGERVGIRCDSTGDEHFVVESK